MEQKAWQTFKLAPPVSISHSRYGTENKENSTVIVHMYQSLIVGMELNQEKYGEAVAITVSISHSRYGTQVREYIASSYGSINLS